jgi:hypothetical protein
MEEYVQHNSRQCNLFGLLQSSPLQSLYSETNKLQTKLEKDILIMLIKSEYFWLEHKLLNCSKQVAYYLWKLKERNNWY